MKDGIIQQVDTPQHAYEHPNNKFVAGFIGSPQMNFIDSDITEKNNKLFIQFSNNALLIPDDKAEIIRELGYIGKGVTFGIRPEKLYDDDRFIAEHQECTVNADVEVTELMGSVTYLYLKVSDVDMTAKVNAYSKSKACETVKLGFDLSSMHIFDRESELNIF
jgi:multiple sugar transport system ATP-binding protein